MRRFLALAAVATALAAPLLPATPALACNPPEGGTCCEPPELFSVDLAGQHVGVPDPTWKPWLCE